MEKLIMTPGPTFIRENVREAMGKAITNPDLDLEFYDFYVDVGDILYFPPGMFNNEKVLCFGDVKSIYGKDMNKYTRDDLLIIKKGNDIYYLKRYYG